MVEGALFPPKDLLGILPGIKNVINFDSVLFIIDPVDDLIIFYTIDTEIPQPSP